MIPGKTTNDQVLRGTLTVGNIQYMFEFMKELYRLLAEAARELVTNAIEAGATNITITFYSEKGGKSFFLVEDNGCGMDQQQLYRVGVSIFESIKRGRGDLTGRHGIGLPSSAKRLGGTRLLVVSRALAKQEIFALEFPLQGAKIDFEVAPHQKHQITGSGTKVFVLGLEEEQRQEIARAMVIRKNSGTSHLCDSLARAFSAEILNRGIKIRLEVRGKNQSDEYVNPPVFAGIPIPLESIKTKFGVIEFDLRCKPTHSTEAACIQHAVGSVVADITDLPDFRDGVWKNFVGSVKAPWLERSGGGVALNHKTYKVFASVLKREIEPKLVAFHRQVSEEQVAADEVYRLRDVFRQVLGGESLFLKDLQMPPTRVISADGEPGDFVRSSLSQTPGPITAKHAGREPYASPIVTDSVSTLTPVKTRRAPTQRVGSLQWRLMAFSLEKQHLQFEVCGGQILINTANADYAKFIDPTNYKKKGLTRITLKLMWLARITCQVIVDWNFPVKEHEESERLMHLGLLFSQVCILLLK